MTNASFPLPEGNPVAQGVLSALASFKSNVSGHAIRLTQSEYSPGKYLTLKVVGCSRSFVNDRNLRSLEGCCTGCRVLQLGALGASPRRQVETNDQV